MARYDVRFQLQAGSKNIDSVGYHHSELPCRKQDALEKLAQLWAQNREYFRDTGWNSQFKEAIEKAERAVKNANG